MQKSELNDWLQVIASIGVLIGLLLVFVEIRQTNEIARAEARVSALTAWEELKRLEIESDISEIYLKSVESPDELTTSEVLRLDAYFVSIITILQKYVALYEAGLHWDPTETFQSDVEYLFDGPFARAWFDLNKSWIGINTPLIVEVIERHIESSPMQTEYRYLNELSSRFRRGDIER